MSLRAKRQRCGIPPTSIDFILQLGLMWSSFTSLPRDLSSTDASRLKEKNTDVKSRSNLLCLDTVLRRARFMTHHRGGESLAWFVRNWDILRLTGHSKLIS